MTRRRRIWQVPRSLPDDPRWVSAYVEIISGWQEDADTTIHPISLAQAEGSWQEALRSPACFNEQRQSAAGLALAWHESEAVRQEAAGNWFAAAFHLRWLGQLEPQNNEWQQRLVKAKEHLHPPAAQR